MALRKPFVMSSEGFAEEVPVADSLDVGAITINAAGAGIDAGNKRIQNVGDGTASTDALTKAQIETLIATGNIFKEPLFSVFQLKDGASGGIGAEQPWAAANQPTAGDTIVVTDGTSTVTFTFVANQGAEATENDVSIESSGETAMDRWILRANAHSVFSTKWTASRCDMHPELQGDGMANVHVVEDVAAIANESPPSTSRIYGTWATQADFNTIEFQNGGGVIQYNQGTVIDAPTSDPGAGRFGLRRSETELVDGEVHLVLDENAQYSWEDSAQQWNQISGVGSIPDATSGSGGGTKGLATFDSDKGLQILSAGIAEMKLEADKGIEFGPGGGAQIKIDDTPDTLDVDSDGLKVSGVPTNFKIGGTATSANVSSPNLGTLTAGPTSDAQALHDHADKSEVGHTHTHAELTGVGANDHHNQVHVLDGPDHTVSGLTAGHVLTATGATSFAFQSPASANEAKKIEDTLNTATDTTADGDPVYINGNNTVGLARADTDTKARVTGVIRTGGGTAPTPVEIVSAGPCEGILGGGGVANTPYYVQATGGIGTSLPGSNNRVICVGYALNADDLFVRITDYGKKAA